MLGAIERDWLDPVRLPLRERLGAWCPDPVDAYCDRCGRGVGPHEADEFGCAACRDSRPPWDALIRLGSYEPPLSGWVHELKFGAWRESGVALGRLLGGALMDAGVLVGAAPGSAVIAPVPTTWRRRMARGVDHTLCLARGVSRETGLPMRRVLGRRHRPSQRSVAPSMRARNVAGSFSVRGSGEAVRGRLVVLVDDVLTTGSTLRGASRALAGAGARGVVGCVATVAEPR